MKEEYSKPSLEVLGELRDVTAASQGGLIADLIGGSTGSDPYDGSN